MDNEELRDRMFDVLNETDELPIEDIEVDVDQEQIKIFLTDGTVAIVQCKVIGMWNLINYRKK